MGVEFVRDEFGGIKDHPQSRQGLMILPATRTWMNRFVALFAPSTRLRLLQNHPQNLLLDLRT